MIVPNHERIEALAMALASIADQDYPGDVHVYLVYKERPNIGPFLETLGPDVTPIAFRADDDRNPIAVKRNLGLDAASEDLVALLDDDDVWHPMKLSLQVEALHHDAEAVAICTAFVPFTMQPTWPARPDPPRVRQLSRHAVLRGGAVVTSSMLFRARALDPLRFDERPGWQAVEDYDLKIRLRQSGRVWRVEGALTGIRVANSSLSSVDRRSQHAKMLSVLAESGRHGTPLWLRRMVALEGVPVASLAGEGAISEAATSELARALDGRLFGRLDSVVGSVIRMGWRSPRVAFFAHAVRAQLRARQVFKSAGARNHGDRRGGAPLGLHIHYHSDCDSFAGCEQMLVVLLQSAQQSGDTEATFSYRHSTTYAEVAQQRLPTGIPIKALALPDANAVRSRLGRSFHGRTLWALKAITYAVPLRQAFQIFDVVKLWFLFRRTCPTVVHINNGGFPGAASCNAAAVAARLAGVPVVVYVVNNIASGYRSPLRWADFPLDRIAARCVTRFVTGSETAAGALRDVLKLNDEHVVSIHNAVVVGTPDMSPDQLRASLGLHDDELVIASIGRLELRKGHRHLVEAFSQLRDGLERQSVVLILAGAGPEEADLRRQVSDMGLDDYVRIVGHMPNIWALLAAADAVVLPSIELEDFPFVVLEAMAMAKPVVASAVAGVPEQVADGETGLLVGPGDVGALSRALNKIVTDGGARKRLGDAAIVRYNQMFTPDVAARRYRELYRDLVAIRRSS